MIFAEVDIVNESPRLSLPVEGDHLRGDFAQFICLPICHLKLVKDVYLSRRHGSSWELDEYINVSLSPLQTKCS